MVSEAAACARTNPRATQDNEKLFQLPDQICIIEIDFTKKSLLSSLPCQTDD